MAKPVPCFGGDKLRRTGSSGATTNKAKAALKRIEAEMLKAKKGKMAC